ncbi:MAG: phosphate acetyltransferase [Acidobacteria bacterium]|nr:phosphate acetyltransferase [Acidobacteriota bacterium]
MSLPPSAVEFMAGHLERARAQRPKMRIVFPEGDDGRVIEAAVRLKRDGLLEPILIGPRPAQAPREIEFLEPESSPNIKKYAAVYYERRRSRGVTHMEAEMTARRPLYFAKLMLAAGDADGCVGGASTTTAEAVRAGLQCIGTAAGVRTVSSVFFLCVRDRSFGHNGVLALSDCAINIEPSSVQLADIAIATAHSVRTLLGVEPSVALLSFSTKGSGKHRASEKVVEALRIVRARAPELHADGELQADAALVPAVGRSKAPGSTVAGAANTLIFPDLASANIAYKMVERLGDAAAIGPFLQGLAKAGNDLSRGCSVEDIYNVGVVTAIQAQAGTASSRAR